MYGLNLTPFFFSVRYRDGDDFNDELTIDMQSHWGCVDILAVSNPIIQLHLYQNSRNVLIRLEILALPPLNEV